MLHEPDVPVGDGRVGRTVSKHSVVVKKKYIQARFEEYLTNRPHFDVICDLFLNRPTATWNHLFCRPWRIVVDLFFCNNIYFLRKPKTKQPALREMLRHFHGLYSHT